MSSRKPCILSPSAQAAPGRGTTFRHRTTFEQPGTLRRVLLAFASFNPDVSYVQGMNFIAAGLLATLPEDASFWMLVLIVEQWLPGHFGPRMMGNHVDCRVLGLLTTQHLPRLADGLKSLEVSTQLLTARWF